MKLKDPINPTKMLNVVYSVPSSVCPAVLAGQTSRQLSTRLQGRKCAVETADFNAPVVAEHAWDEHHQIDWDKATIVTFESNLNRGIFIRVVTFSFLYNCSIFIYL